MSDLIRVCISDLVYILGQDPFNYIVALFVLTSIIGAIFLIVKGGVNK